MDGGFWPQMDGLNLGDSLKSAGVFEFFDTVFTNSDYASYYNYMNPEMRDFITPERPREDYQKQRYYKLWRTFQVSDHLPMWAELKIDFSDDYLKLLSAGY